jgi:hypothetical protein
MNNQMVETTIPISEQSLIFRLRKRAEIRRSIPSRKSVQDGEPDRIADLLEEAAERLSYFENREFREAVATGIVDVTFIKRDGTERKMLCTNQPLWLGFNNLPLPDGRETPDTLFVTDTELKQPRAIRYDSILKWTKL